MDKDNKKKDLMLAQRDLKDMVDKHHHQLRMCLVSTIDKKYPNQDCIQVPFQLDNEYIRMHPSPKIQYLMDNLDRYHHLNIDLVSN